MQGFWFLSTWYCQLDDDASLSFYGGRGGRGREGAAIVSCLFYGQFLVYPVSRKCILCVLGDNSYVGK